MKTVEQVILNLLFKHDCVIVPDFGGFVAKRKSAQFDAINACINPPSKQILFNVQLTQNDGLLINAFGQENGLAYYQSHHEVEASTQRWKHEINEGRVLTIRELGTFKKDTEGNIQFEQSEQFNLLLSSFGLSSITFVPRVIKVKELSEEKGTKRKSNLWKYAAAACILPLAFYSIWIPTKTNAIESGLISLNDFNPFFKHKPAAYQEKPLKIKSIEADSENFYVDLVQKKIALNKEETNLELQSFHCIAGCFSNLQNAQSLVSNLKLKGYNAQILPGGPLYRVSMGGGFSEESMVPIKTKAASDGYEAWILR